ncbi:hypothetical protein BTW10_02550 [Chromohalobacter japonicus]|uniref:HTH gntR-type domain-containing protein n=2 Tax=Chromohalobacter japonicus TaxID=223900 RepID=A0A1Q8TGD4_9GAMM|nr:hypothetical protein BTW10_02550 [Chromohalobacter japonicus]
MDSGDAAVSLVTMLAQQVETMIIDAVLPAGARINENALAQELGVGRSTLREAVRQLESNGLVTLVPNRGVFVRKVSLQEALHLFDCRAGLARAGGRLVAARATSEQAAHLSTLHDGMIKSCHSGDLDLYYSLNEEFHKSLMDCSGNARLAALDDVMSNELQLFRRKNLGNIAQLETSIQEHEKIIEGVLSHDQNKCAAAFERHIISAKQRMLETLPAYSAD